MKFRTLFFLPILLILLFPIFGYQSIVDRVQQLEGEHERHLAVSAQIIATAIEHNPVFLNNLVSQHRDVTIDLYSQKLNSKILLDGRKDDWVNHTSTRYGDSNLVAIFASYVPESLSFELMLGTDDEFLYAFYQIKDDLVIYREINNPSVHRNDHVSIAMLDQQGAFHRYTIATHQPTEVVAQVISPTGRALRSEPRINGFWRATDAGYNLEIRMPHTMVGGKFATTVADVDDVHARFIQYRMGSAETDTESTLGTLFIPSSDLKDYLADLPFSRISLLSANNQIVLTTGEIITTEGGVFDYFSPPRVLKGRQAIRSGGSIIGDLLIEDANNNIRLLHHDALIRLMLQTAMLSSLGFFIWFCLATLISRRFHGLGKRLESMVDAQGRIREAFSPGHSGDEIGDLERGISDVLERITQYNRYLESMSSRLSHELRTPVSVVRSSLEHLDREELNTDQLVYIERAHQGLERLSSILNKMAEASRLEESLDEDDLEIFNLIHVLEGCVKGYETVFPDNSFELNNEVESVTITGIPDLIAQLLDKLVSNAVEFSREGKVIRIRLTIERDHAMLRIINEGSPLPVDTGNSLLDSMVSIRDPGRQDAESHLGLGLYIAKVIVNFHGGEIKLRDREDLPGVIVTVSIPLMRLTSKLKP